ncbi:MAG: MFS transporter [Chloroflexi bacterium]|nr:MFS transporter [Chloroflexota bacterium]
MSWRAYLLGPVLALALLPSNVVAAAIPLLRAEWSASGAAAGFVFAAYQIGYLASVLVLLPLTDRVPAGRVIAGSAVATSLAFLLFPLLANDVWSAVGLRFLAGLGLAGIYMPGVRVVAASAPPERRGFAVGAYVSAFYLGAAVSLWLTGLLLPGLGWRGAALVLGAISIGALPLAILSTRGVAAPSRGSARLDPAILRHGPVLRTILAYTGHSWELYVSRGWLAAFVASVLAANGLDDTRAAAQGSQWAALMAGFGTPGVWLGGWFSDHLGRARAALLIALLSGVCSLSFGFLGAGPWAILIVVGCIYGLLLSADSAVYSTAVTELAPPGRLGSAQAVQAFLGFGATVAAPVAAGLALDLGLGWGGTFVLAGVVGLGLALPLLPMARGVRPTVAVS